MLAVAYDRYGPIDVTELRDVEEPRAPGRGQLLVDVTAAALNPKDVLVRKGYFKVFTRSAFPRRMGYDWCGVVRSVGAGIDDVSVGDRMFGMISAWMGGALADRVVVSRRECARAPRGIDDVGAASLPLVCLTALQALRDLGRVGRGDRVCINGASGGLGTVAIQIARALGGRVSTTSSAANLVLCRSLGAEVALDYADARAEPFAAGRAYDVVFDVFGNQSFSKVRPSLTKRGVYVQTIPSKRIVLDAARTLVGGQRARLVVVRSRRKDLEVIGAMAERGELRPVIDEVFALEAFRAAQARVETRRSRGKVVVRVKVDRGSPADHV